MSRNVLLALLLTTVVMLATAAAEAQQKTEAAQQKTEATQGQTQAAPKTESQEQTGEAQAPTEDPKLTPVPGGKALGMSILGNQEAPKALVIVPWKRSELGNALDVSTMLDDSRLPIDKEVFMRMLSYHEIRSGTPRSSAAPATTNAAQPSAAAQRRNP
jgi:hypothetical protein